MKTIILGAMLLCSLAGVVLASPPVFTSKSYEDAKKQAAAEHKLLIVDSMADWCGPCKHMDKTTWVDEKVIGWVKDNAIAFQFDVDADRKLASDFKIAAMPTMIVFKDGKEVDRSVGYLAPADLLSWLGDVKQGKTKLDALRAKAGDRMKDGKVDVQSRLNLARALSQSSPKEAADEYEWLWDNMVKYQPSMVGVRGSFMVSDMQRLADNNEDAKARFTKMRDGLEAKLKAKDATSETLRDWMDLNNVVGDDDRTVAWYDRVKADPAAKRDIQGAYRLKQLLRERGRWADLGKITTNPVAEAKQSTMILTVASAREDGDKGHDEMMKNHARMSVAQLYAGLLAAEREKDADKVAKVLLDKLDDAASRRMLVQTAIEAHQPRRRHAALLDEADQKDPDNQDAALRTGLKNASK